MLEVFAIDDAHDFDFLGAGIRRAIGQRRTNKAGTLERGEIAVDCCSESLHVIAGLTC